MKYIFTHPEHAIELCCFVPIAIAFVFACIVTIKHIRETNKYIKSLWKKDEEE
jgi:hypothetical protein